MRRLLAVSIMAASATGGAPLDAAMTPLERQRLAAHLEMTAAWLADEVSGLTEGQYHFRPGQGQWSIAETLDHLVVVAPVYWQDLQTALKQKPRGGSAMTDADVLWYGIDRTRRERAIPSELPGGKPRDLASAIAEYRRHHLRLVQYVRTTEDDLRAHIVERQGSDAYQWALLISTHEQRHVLQIREIKAHVAFPAAARSPRPGE